MVRRKSRIASYPKTTKWPPGHLWLYHGGYMGISLRAILLAAAGAALVAPVGPALAAAKDSFAVSIPAQTLDKSLFEIARRAGKQLIFTDRKITRLQAPALDGQLTLNQMLAQVLSGSGYSFVLKGEDTIRIVSARQAAAKTGARLAMAGNGVPSLAMAQAAASTLAETAPPPEPIVVIGSQIKRAQVDEVLPVTVLGEDQIEARNAASGAELFTSIPQVGAIAFNEQNSGISQNAARGDVASINLRSLGTGNTLMLINGRRMVLNPGFQTELLVPVVSPDLNEISPGSVKRIEVLRDGASAIYGADAVAGVINTELKGGMTGGFLEGDWRTSTGTSLYSYRLGGGLGFDFSGGRGNLTVYGSYFYENGAPASMRRYSAFDDRRPLVEGTPFEGDSQFNNLNTRSAYLQGDIQASGSSTPLNDDDFFIQPESFGGCEIILGGGLCANAGTTPPTNLRYSEVSDNDLFSRKKRINASAVLSYELTDSIEFYADGSYYRSEADRQIEAAAILSAVTPAISRNAYYNPFGAAVFPNGVANPNRIPVSTLPAGGADVLIERYRMVDFGPRQVSVNKDSFRLFAGLRGNFGAWDFDTGILYSQANNVDLARNRQSRTAFMAAVNRSTPDAYNPFNGGCLDNTAQGDCTPNPQSVLDPIRIDVFRKGETTLALADFKLSNASLFELPGGNLGVAAGIEARRETFKDDRDPRLDGTITYTDPITGEFFGSDVIGTSPSPDTSGSREVFSAFAEVIAPIVSPEMGIPLVSRLEIQVAGRVEHFTDIDETTAVPRIAGAWSIIPDITVRGAWSRGFRAPNLVQVFDAGTTRVNTRDDFVRCYAEVQQGVIGNIGECTGSGVISVRSGTEALKPEKSENYSFGLVLQPRFVPGLTLTADYWNIRQDGLVGVFDDQNQIALDLLRRLNGSTNPNVVRTAASADDVALFAGTGLDAAGEIVQVLDPYTNLDFRKTSGWDFGLTYRVPDFGIGRFTAQLNAAYLKTFFQSSGPLGQELITAVDDGVLPPDVSVESIGDLIEQDGRPKWRLSGSLLWESGPVRASLFGRYVGKVFDTGVTNDDTGEPFPVDDWFVLNAAISYTIRNDTSLDGTRLRVGMNNILNEAPPLADETFGFFSELHDARGRQFTVSLRKDF